MKKLYLIIVLSVISSTLAITSNAALDDRGNGLIYDDVLNITWLQDANLAKSNTFGVSGILTDGSMNWNTAHSWISAMNATSYKNITDWRMPLCSQGVGPVATCTNSELHLLRTGSGISTSSPEPFINLQLGIYWMGTEVSVNNARAYNFTVPPLSSVISQNKNSNFYVWAVHPGDVPVVPEPVSSMLFVTGGAILAGRRYLRRKD